MSEPKTSPDVALIAAFCAAQGEVDALLKNAKNPHFGKAYADMVAVRDAIKEPMARHGLAMYQETVSSTDDIHTLLTWLVHEGGGTMCARMPIAWSSKTSERGRSAAQSLGSAITYSRRYAVMALWNLAPEDDDGNAARQPEQRRREQPHRQADPPPKLYDWRESLKHVGVTLGEANTLLRRKDERPMLDLPVTRQRGFVRWLASDDGQAELVALRAEDS